MRELIKAYKLLLLLILLSLAGIFYLIHSPAPEAQKPPQAKTEPLRVIEPSRHKEVMLFEATAYCQGEVTFTGTKPQEGRTVATDPEVIPLGTKLIINGKGDYVAEDTGGLIRGNRLDIYLEDYSRCIEFGRQTVRVEIKEGRNEQPQSMDARP